MSGLSFSVTKFPGLRQEKPEPPTVSIAAFFTFLLLDNLFRNQLQIDSLIPRVMRRRIKVGHVPVVVKVLVSPEDKRNGFMGWKHCPENFGMLFINHAAKKQSFWMPDVPFDLEALGFDDNNILVQVLALKAMDRTSRSFSRAVKHVVEMPAGWCKKNGIEPGCSLTVSQHQPEANR
jgi:uncharacterized membrane protein (UPF0127 family)